MAAVAAIFTILTCLVFLVWISRHLMIHRERRNGFLLTEEYPGSPDDAPMVSVLVAAKDEAENIETCVRTMLRQNYPNFELIVCDDRSEDGTGEIVERIAAEDDRLRLIRIRDLPAGWCGKNNAMNTGIREARGQWICMIDADCRQTSDRTLSVAVQYALDTEADMLSVLPILEMRGFWENVVQPVCGGVMMIWFHPEKVNNPDKPNAYANGAFMLMKRSTYEAIGGHEAFKDKLNEDMHMALGVKRRGLRLRVARSQGLYLVRMYTSLPKILRGWSRIFYGTFGTAKRLSISLLVILVMGVLPYVSAALGLALAAAGAAPNAWWWACGIAGAAAVAMQLSVIFRFYRLIRAKPALAWTYVLGCLIAAAALIGALLKLRSRARVVWRNTSYSEGS